MLHYIYIVECKVVTYRYIYNVTNAVLSIYFQKNLLLKYMQPSYSNKSYI